MWSVGVELKHQGFSKMKPVWKGKKDLIYLTTFSTENVAWTVPALGELPLKWERWAGEWNVTEHPGHKNRS